jgi:hypothetical protein
MINYELIEIEAIGKVVKKTDSDGKFYWIPLDEGNADYQRYLRWLENPDAEEGGTL